MSKTPTKSADERATEIIESIRRQMRGAAAAAKRAGAPLTQAGVNDEARDAIINALAPLWADVQAGLKGVKVGNNGSETPLLDTIRKASATRKK